MNSKTTTPHWEHFEHEADIGIHGIAPTLEQAFEQAAVAMTAVVTDPALYRTVPAGVGSRGRIHLNHKSMHGMLTGGAQWAIEQGFGEQQDLERIEEHGCMAGAEPHYVSPRARERQKDEMGTLGSGNHYLEVQQVAEIFDRDGNQFLCVVRNQRKRTARVQFGLSWRGAMSRSKASQQWQGRTLVEELAARGIIIRSPSMRGVAEEAPAAYKDVSAVVDIANRAGLARKVARMEPVICIKG